MSNPPVNENWRYLPLASSVSRSYKSRFCVRATCTRFPFTSTYSGALIRSYDTLCKATWENECFFAVTTHGSYKVFQNNKFYNNRNCIYFPFFFRRNMKVSKIESHIHMSCFRRVRTTSIWKRYSQWESVPGTLFGADDVSNIASARSSRNWFSPIPIPMLSFSKESP